MGTVAGQGPDRPCRRETIHLGHLHVHQDEVVVRCACLGQRLAAIDGDIDCETDGMQHLQRHLAIDLVVLGQQQACAGMRLAQFGLGHRSSGVAADRHDAVAAMQAGGEPEGAAAAGFAVDADARRPSWRARRRVIASPRPVPP